jgi:hypothetical protein
MHFLIFGGLKTDCFKTKQQKEKKEIILKYVRLIETERENREKKNDSELAKRKKEKVEDI